MLTVHVLGPVEVRRDGEAVDLGGPLPRAVVAHLALTPGRVLSVERLVDRLWGDDPPRRPLGALQSYVSRLRRALEPARGAGAAPQILVSQAPGYALQLAPEQVDLHRFRTLVTGARAALADGRPAAALDAVDVGLGLWRGPALAGLGPHDQVRPVVVQLEEERDSAVELRFEAMLALGRDGEAVPLLQAAVEESPLRERRWALLALALYRGSRQADALRALGSARAVLRDELGLDPGAELRDLERRILAQDPALSVRPAVPVDPIQLVAAAAAAPLEPPAASAGPELVGREAEWRGLLDALGAAGAGRPQLVLLEGEPGIGKSTLSDVFVAHARGAGWHTAVGRAVEPDLAPSLWPWIELVRGVLAEAGPAAAGAAAPLRQWESGTDADLALTPVEAAGHVVGLLDQLGLEPCVVLLDDLHWADQATLDVTRLVLERLGNRRVLVVGAHRPPELEPGSPLGGALGGLRRAAPTTRIRMSPLTPPDVARLMELTVDVAPPPELADRVAARAGGNPLFVVELARLAGERGLADERSVPDAIRDVVRGRLAQLPERATAELEVAAVLGERFDLRVAMAVSDRDADDCLDALDAAIVTRILVADGAGFRFAHALVRDAVLADVSPMRLARLHHRAAETLATVHGDVPDVAEPLAHHRLASVPFGDALVIARAAVRAADVARWRFALDVADRLAEAGLDVLATVPYTPAADAIGVEALESIISSAYRRGDRGPTADVARRIQDFADRTGSDAATALSLFFHWGDIDGTEDLGEVAGPVEQAAALAATTSDSYALVTANFMVGAYALLRGRIDEAMAHVDAAIAASGAVDPDDPPTHVPLVVLPTLASVGAALLDQGDRAREHAHRRSPAWFARRNEVDPTTGIALAFNRALTEALLDDPAAVLAVLADARRAEAVAFVLQEVATCDLLDGWARARLGDAEGVARAFAAIDEIDRDGERVLRPCLRTFVGAACLAADDPRAVTVLEEASDEARSRGEVFWLSETVRLQAVADVRWGGGGVPAGLLLDEAERLATEHGARLVLRRIAATRTSLGRVPDPARD